MRRATPNDLDNINAWAGADFRDFLGFSGNVILIEGNGGALFAWRGPGIYEVHVFFAQRGREVLDLSRRMLNYMRGNHAAHTFWSAIPVESRKVKLFARWMGWKSQGTALFPHGECEVFLCPQQ